MKNEKIAINKLSSDLSGLLSEHELGQLNKETLISYFSCFLQDAEVDDKIIFSVLEDFGKEGKEEILAIKIKKGY